MPLQALVAIPIPSVPGLCILHPRRARWVMVDQLPQPLLPSTIPPTMPSLPHRALASPLLPLAQGRLAVSNGCSSAAAAAAATEQRRRRLVVVMCGAALEAVSAGRYRAATHCVTKFPPPLPWPPPQTTGAVTEVAVGAVAADEEDVVVPGAGDGRGLDALGETEITTTERRLQSGACGDEAWRETEGGRGAGFDGCSAKGKYVNRSFGDFVAGRTGGGSGGCSGGRSDFSGRHRVGDADSGGVFCSAGGEIMRHSMVFEFRRRGGQPPVAKLHH